MKFRLSVAIYVVMISLTVIPYYVYGYRPNLNGSGIGADLLSYASRFYDTFLNGSSK